MIKGPNITVRMYVVGLFVGTILFWLLRGLFENRMVLLPLYILVYMDIGILTCGILLGVFLMQKNRR